MQHVSPESGTGRQKIAVSEQNVILTMAFAGILSGLATQMWTQFSPLQDPLIFGTSTWPGFFFGLAISYGVLRWGGIRFVGVFFLILIIIASWIAAREFSDATFNTEFNKAAAYMISTIIGSMGTALGVLVVSKTARQVPITVIMLSSLAGLLCTLAVSPLFQVIGEYISWVMFPLWQASVAAAIGYGLKSAAKRSI